jgi:hypothetical protein
MDHLINQEASDYFHLQLEANEIIRRTMTHLWGTNIFLISAETSITESEQLCWLAQEMCKSCNRVVILVSQSEYTQLVIAKSTNVEYLDVDEIAESIAQNYDSQSYENTRLAHVIFTKLDIMPNILDQAVESVIIALPS